jgi:hypothetical protein
VPGERIVVSGNFLLDSESRMKLPAVSSPAAMADRAVEKDAVCGMDVDPDAPNAIRTQFGGPHDPPHHRPFRAPNLNPQAERVVRTIKEP